MRTDVAIRTGAPDADDKHLKQVVPFQGLIVILRFNGDLRRQIKPVWSRCSDISDKI